MRLDIGGGLTEEEEGGSSGEKVEHFGTGPDEYDNNFHFHTGVEAGHPGDSHLLWQPAAHHTS